MTLPRELSAGALALVPMTGAVLGASVDERMHFGYSNWVSVCRASGFRIESLISFTFDLLPMALIGMLIGGLVLQFVGATLWFRHGGARVALAAHAGCALGMLAALLLCALAPSTSWMLGVELLVAATAAMGLCRWPAHRPDCAPAHP